MIGEQNTHCFFVCFKTVFVLHVCFLENWGNWGVGTLSFIPLLLKNSCRKAGPRQVGLLRLDLRRVLLVPDLRSALVHLGSQPLTVPHSSILSTGAQGPLRQFYWLIDYTIFARAQDLV